MQLARACLCVIAFALLSAGSASAAEQRFALLLGNDLGDNNTEPLLYARQDARRMRDVLVRLAGVPQEHAVVLLGRDAKSAKRALMDLEARVRDANRAGARTTLIVYYSGHARQEQLLLGETSWHLEDLRQQLHRSSATLRLAIIDACGAGAITRSKGVRKTPAFQVESTATTQAEGFVILASSSFDEDAQESDHLGGSYFTHHFLNGLQGAADSSGDGKVTLAEAYEHTYKRTVGSTADSAAGPQHPTFRYDLKGSGDFVISEYARRNEGLHLPASAPGGTYFLVDKSGVVAAEIDKAPAQERRVAVAVGAYTVKRRLPDRLRVGQVTVMAGRLTTLDESAMKDAPFSDDPVKGARRDVGSHWSMGLGLTTQTFFDQPTRESLFPNSGLMALELQLADFFRRDWLLGFDVAAGGGQGLVEHPTAAIAFETRQLNLGGSLLRQWRTQDGDWLPFVGMRVAFLFLSRRFEEQVLPEQMFSTFSPGVFAGLRYRITPRLSVFGRARLHYLLYNVDENRSLGFLELTAALGYDL